ncbi:MAG: PPC domain-containing protein [Deltaproteobacteria bacterium]|nr:PPC domain-containing protein [Deltaproteobacteria bacterium]
MTSHAKGALLVLALGLTACTVEPPTFGTDAGTADVGFPDAGFPDSGPPDCLRDPGVCGPAQFCSPDGVCLERDRECGTSLACGPHDVCVRPVVPTSTTSLPGTCQPPPGACRSDAECGGGHCLPAGICAPTAARAALSGDALVPEAACGAGPECGVAGVCRDGVCSACAVNADCGGGLRCESGACVEPSRCEAAADCFVGNRCTGGRCQRRVDACAAESENDDADHATVLEDAAYLGLEICGADVDYYALSVPEGLGVQVILRSDPAQATLRAELQDAIEDPVPSVGTLALPGLYLLQANPEDGELLLKVWSTDQSGGYDLLVRYVPGLCQDDAVGLYGDAQGLMVPGNIAYTAVACPGRDDLVRVDAAPGDRLLATATFLGAEGEPSVAIPEARFVDAQGQVVDEGMASTTGTTAAAATAPRPSPGALGLRVRARQLPTAGEAYAVRLTRVFAGRVGACDDAPVVNPNLGVQRVQGDLSAAVDLGRPTCAGAGGVFALPERRDALVRLAPPTEDVLMVANLVAVTGTDPRPSLALLTDCTDDDTAVACHTAPFPRSVATVEALLLAGEARTLMVSSDGRSEDVTYELEVSYTSVVSFANDRCAEATPLTTSSTQAVLLYGGTGWGAQDDDRLWSDLVSGACAHAAGDGAGVDRFYALELNPGELAAVELTGPQGALLWSGLACDTMPASCTGAVVRDFSNPVARLTFTASTSGTTHYVAVDGIDATDQGTYVLRTVRNAACLIDTDCQGPNLNRCGGSPCRCDDFQCRLAPDNDRCNGERLDFGGADFGSARVTGSTGAANDDYTPTCLFAGQPDVVYSVAVPAGASELVARITQATFDPALEIRRDTCVDGGGDVWCQDDLVYGEVLNPEIRVREPAAGVYYLVVDSFAGEGAFTLEVEVLP